MLLLLLLLLLLFFLLLLLLLLLVFFILTHLATDCSHPLPQAAAFSLSFFIIINFHMKLFACPLKRCCKETARPLGDEIHERVLPVLAEVGAILTLEEAQTVLTQNVLSEPKWL